MLNPDQRTLYTDALRPPPGFRFGAAIATTYSLDLQTLLTIPLHLALFSTEERPEELLEDGVALLEALRRTTRDITVFAQSSRLLAPGAPHVLYGLLEKVVVEVTPPSENGVFHPKVWLLRFDNPDTGAIRPRLLVLSRNITNDRCWDLALTLDGRVEDGVQNESRPLSRFIRALPELALHAMEPAKREQVRSLATMAHRTRWEPPEGFEAVRFHDLGRKGAGSWLPDRSQRLALVSPFVSTAALKNLTDSTDAPIALVSRTEELHAIDPAVLERFDRVLTLAAQAEREEGDEPGITREPTLPTQGLHAKAYVAKRGWRTHIYVGSANATNPALVNGTNIEFMAELIGKASQVGAVDDLLDPDGFGALLVDYLTPAEPPGIDEEALAAEQAIENARRELSRAGLALRFTRNSSGIWSVALAARTPPRLQGIEGLTTWLISRQDGTAVDALTLRDGGPVALPEADVTHLTSFVAFELRAAGPAEPVRFVLAVAAQGLPTAERDAAIVRDVLRDEQGFLRYLMLLLAEVGLGLGTPGGAGVPWDRHRFSVGDDDALPLFEHMTRAFCQDPQRLESIDRLLGEMGADGELMADTRVVPSEFLELWGVFRAAMGRQGKARP